MNYSIKRLLFLIVVLAASSTTLFAQRKNESINLTKKQIVGVWQYGSPRVGDGLDQNFEFYSNGNFVFNNGKNGDDAVSTIKLKGKYRLGKDGVYFTITSRVVVDGAKIELVDPGINSGIFAFDNGKLKEIKDLNPKEFIDPAFVTLISKNHIKINSEDYYKISPSLLREQHFSPEVN